MPLKTIPFDGSEFFDTPESQARLLSNALESGHAGYIASALGVVARARGMTAVAKEAGVTREALYKALREDGDPQLSTLLGVLNALGVKLSATIDAPVAIAGKTPPRRPKAKSPTRGAA